MEIPDKNWWGEYRSAVHAARSKPNESVLELDRLLLDVPLSSEVAPAVASYLQNHLTHWLPGHETPPVILAAWLEGSSLGVIEWLASKHSSVSSSHPFTQWFGLMRSRKVCKDIGLQNLPPTQFDENIQWVIDQGCFEPDDRDNLTVGQIKTLHLLYGREPQWFRIAATPPKTPPGQIDGYPMFPPPMPLYQFKPIDALPTLSPLRLRASRNDMQTFELAYRRKWTAVDALTMLETIWVFGGFPKWSKVELSCRFNPRGGEGKFKRGWDAYHQARTALHLFSNG